MMRAPNPKPKENTFKRSVFNVAPVVTLLLFIAMAISAGAALLPHSIWIGGWVVLGLLIFFALLSLFPDSGILDLLDSFLKLAVVTDKNSVVRQFEICFLVFLLSISFGIWLHA